MLLEWIHGLEWTDKENTYRSWNRIPVGMRITVLLRMGIKMTGMYHFDIFLFTSLLSQWKFLHLLFSHFPYEQHSSKFHSRGDPIEPMGYTVHPPIPIPCMTLFWGRYQVVWVWYLSGRTFCFCPQQCYVQIVSLRSLSLVLKFVHSTWTELLVQLNASIQNKPSLLLLLLLFLDPR